jgi:hypothetical protein
MSILVRNSAIFSSLYSALKKVSSMKKMSTILDYLIANKYTAEIEYNEIY